MTETEVFAQLVPEFRLKTHELDRLCGVEGVPILFYCGLRICQEQAILFRRSRTQREVEQRIQSLADRGYPFLADSLASVGPQPGKLGEHVTMAAPGESFHQYGLAVDGVPTIGGKLLWNASAIEWQTYGLVARHLGLCWAGDWTSFPEYPHVQLAQTKSPLTYFKSPALVEQALREAGSL